MKKARCFVCEKVLGSTYMSASEHAPAMCLRCGGRVMGLIMAARAPLVALLREVQWTGDDLIGTICACCSASRDRDGYNHLNPAPCEVDCRLAAAIGASRECDLCHNTGVYEPAGGHEPTTCPRHCMSKVALSEIVAL